MVQDTNSPEVIEKINIELYDTNGRPDALIEDGKRRSLSSSIGSGSVHSGASPSQRDSAASKHFFFRNYGEQRSSMEARSPVQAASGAETADKPGS